MNWYIHNGGYPYLDGVAAASPFRLQENAPQYAWRTMDGGYPYLITHHTAEEPVMTEPYPKWTWKIVVEEGRTQGADYPVLQYERQILVTPVRQFGYITIHDMMTEQEGFGTNGLRILFPESCQITEELNGDYSLTLTHKADAENVWKQILELNIIKCLGQLFTIYRVENSFDGNTGTVTAYARHISYQIADKWILSGNVDAPDGQHAMEQIMRATLPVGLETHYFDFTLTSNIEKPFSMEFSEITPLEAIMGTGGDSLLSAIGGELHRDNFRISLNSAREGAMENAFCIRAGYNLTGIQRDVDYSDFCTYLHGSDNFGNWFAVSYVPDARYAHTVTRSVAFKYDAPDTERLARDTMSYFDTVKNPYITYTITIKDLRNNPDYAQFENISRYRVGDWGVIYDERLGIQTRQQIIKTVTDGITGEVTEVTFGNLERSLTRPMRMANILASPSDQFLMQQISTGEAKAVRNWADASHYTWGEIKKFTWGKLKGGTA